MNPVSPPISVLLKLPLCASTITSSADVLFPTAYNLCALVTKHVLSSSTLSCLAVSCLD